MTFVDQIGVQINLASTPQRIISLVPSQTELLFDLGMEDEVVGITRFCVHPKGWLKEKTKVGGTKNVNLKRVKSLKPDLIIANKEENVKDQIEAFRSICPVWTSDIQTIEDNLNLITDLGDILERKSQAKALVEEIREKRSLFAADTPAPTLSALYLIWDKPLMGAGNDTFIHNMMKEAGFENYVTKNRYPEVSEQDLMSRPPDVLLLSSEPYSFTQTHVEEWQSKLPNSKVILVDGELFSWYGSRIRHAFDYLTQVRKQC